MGFSKEEKSSVKKRKVSGKPGCHSTVIDLTGALEETKEMSTAERAANLNLGNGHLQQPNPEADSIVVAVPPKQQTFQLGQTSTAGAS